MWTAPFFKKFEKTEASRLKPQNNEISTKYWPHCENVLSAFFPHDKP